MAPLPASKVIEALENLYQPLFQDMALTVPTKWKVTNLNDRKAPPKIVYGPAYMGEARSLAVELLQGGHGNIDHRFESHLKNRKLAAVAMKGWRAQITVVGNKTGKVTKDSIVPTRISDFRVQLSLKHGEKNPTHQELSYLAKEAFDMGGKLTRSFGTWVYAVRPIVFENKDCLKCHTESKIGTPAGFMVYALTKDPYVERPTWKNPAKTKPSGKTPSSRKGGG